MARLTNNKFVQQGFTIAIEMDGEPLEAIAGESIAAALVSSGIWEFRRDKSGAPRGPLCGMGVCFECQVSVDDGAPERACLTKVHPGMKIRSSGYRAPRPLPEVSRNQSPRERLDCDVLVVGSGPAGITAATFLADVGASVIIADERPEPGGQFFKPLASSFSFKGTELPDDQYRQGKILIEKLKGTSAKLINDATVWGAFRDQDGNFESGMTASQKSWTVRSRQVILATGAFESVPVFPGWTLPGVMTTGAAQSMARAYRVAPGQRVLIAGNGPLNLHLASELLEGGVEVVAVAESAPTPFPRRAIAAAGSFLNSPGLILQGFRYLSKIKKHRVPLLYGYHISRATGERQVRYGAVSRIDRDGMLIPGTEKKYQVDAVCVGYHLQPSNELARSLGCKHKMVGQRTLVPERDESGQTNIAGVFVVGDSGTLGGAHVAMAEGRIAARAVAHNLSYCGSMSSGLERKILRRHRRFQRNLWSLYDAPELSPTLPEIMVCRCELVSFGKLKSLIESGIRDMGSLKRLTRVGMGPCQGRYCQRAIAKLLRSVTGEDIKFESMFAPRPPAKPTRISSMAMEKPEWSGYRTVDIPSSEMPPITGKTPWNTTNVLIIGAGIIGVCTALYLAKAGIEVMIIDRGVANGEASGGNAGSLHLQMLSSDFSGDGTPGATVAAQALSLQRKGIAAWLDLQRETDENFELEITGGLVVAETRDDIAFLEKKASIERDHGIAVEILGKIDMHRMVPNISDRIIGAAYCEGEGKINPMLATPILLREAIKGGAVFEEQCTVADIEDRNGKYSVVTSKGTITCHKIVNATGGWATHIAAMIGVSLPVRPAPQQMIVTEPTDFVMSHLIALARRHLTMKQAANGNVIIGGGWPAGYAADRGRAVTLRESIEGNLWVAERVFPKLGLLQIIRTWATIGVMIDGAPIVGELPGHPRFFNAVGANGYTMGPILGRITAELASTGELIADIRPFLVDRFN